MRKLLTILLFFICSHLFAQTYYVKNGGNDGNTGLSDAQAWETLAKVNTTTFGADDTILFKCDDLWRGTLVVHNSGTAGHYIVYGSYGTGNRPKILGSTKAITWTAEGHTNIWQSATSLSDPFPNLDQGKEIFYLSGGVVSWGEHQTYTSDFANLTAEYDWTWNANTVYVYAASDPDTRYDSIEVPQVGYLIDINLNKEYIKIDSFELAFSRAGIGGQTYPTNDITGFTISNCVVHHLGSRNEAGYGVDVTYNDYLIEYNEFYECGRRGVSIYNWGAATMENIIIQYNNFHANYHTNGIDLAAGSGLTTGSFDGVYIRNNYIWDDPDRDDVIRSTSNFFSVEQDAYIHNLYIYNNIITYSMGAGLQLEGPAGVYIYNNTFYGLNTQSPNNLFCLNIYDGNNSAATDIHVKNNIFYNDAVWGVNYSVSIYISNGVTPSDIDADYNLYFCEDASTLLIRLADPLTDFHMADFATLQSTWGWETHSPNPTDPLFINVTDPTEVDSLMIDVLSPAVDAGIGLGYYTTKDYLDSLRDASPDIGAIEYGSTSFDPPDPPTVTTSTPTVIYTRLARAGGNCTDDGGGTVSAKGYCWSTSANPTTSDSKVSGGTGTGAFSGYIPNLKASTTYHVRSFATNETATVYGSDLTFTTPAKSYVKTGGKYLKTNGNIVIIR